MQQDSEVDNGAGGSLARQGGHSITKPVLILKKKRSAPLMFQNSSKLQRHNSASSYLSSQSTWQLAAAPAAEPSTALSVSTAPAGPADVRAAQIRKLVLKRLQQLHKRQQKHQRRQQQQQDLQCGGQQQNSQPAATIAAPGYVKEPSVERLQALLNQQQHQQQQQQQVLFADELEQQSSQYSCQSQLLELESSDATCTTPSAAAAAAEGPAGPSISAVALAVRVLLTLAARRVSPELANQLRDQLLLYVRSEAAAAEAAGAHFAVAEVVQKALPSLRSAVAKACKEIEAYNAAAAAAAAALAQQYKQEVVAKAAAAVAHAMASETNAAAAAQQMQEDEKVLAEGRGEN